MSISQVSIFIKTRRTLRKRAGDLSNVAAWYDEVRRRGVGATDRMSSESASKLSQSRVAYDDANKVF